jgi:hypothetical protein
MTAGSNQTVTNMPGGPTAAGGRAAQAGNMNGQVTADAAASAAASLATKQGVATPSMSALETFTDDAAICRGFFNIADVDTVLLVLWLWLP